MPAENPLCGECHLVGLQLRTMHVEGGDARIVLEDGCCAVALH